MAATWDYCINSSDTPGTIDTANTFAIVDTLQNEIRLPENTGPDIVSFWSTGEYDYVVLTATGAKHYSFDGARMQENAVLSVGGLSNPLALAAPDPYPDVVVVDSSGLRHYSFTGSGMAENPALSVAGLANTVAIGVGGTSEVAGLVKNQVQHYSFTGSSMERNTFLEPSVTFTNPIDMALYSDGYDLAVLDENRVRYFNFTGSGMAENPALAVTGLTAPRAIASGDGYDVTVVDGKQVKHFSFTGSSLVYNTALSVTSGLTAPSAVAIRPGSYDRIIVDGNRVKYYSWNGSRLVYNPALSVTVSDIVQGVYAPAAVVTSLSRNPGGKTEYVRVRAHHVLPESTSVTWSVAADGTGWVKKWRVRGLAEVTVCEVSPDNGITWNPIGDASVCAPEASDTRLWVQVEAGRQVKWKAELATANPGVTPKIKTSPPGGVAVRLDTNAKPTPPVVDTSGVCYTTTTPTLTWRFSDPDPGDSQSAFQVQIVRASDNAPVLDSGKVKSSDTQYTVPTSTAPDTPGPLWSAETYRFKVRVKVWDMADMESDWSKYADFCVVAFERPRVAQIISPPAGQVAPNPADPATHIVITPGMIRDQLPRAKAGAKVVLLVDSVGPLTSFTSVFPYTGPKGDQTATVNTPEKLPDGVTSNPMYPEGNPVNRWAVEFWTDPSLEVCPEGTVVKMNLYGNSNAGTTDFDVPPYADGVVVTEGSIYDSWFVVLQGRDES